MQPMQMALSVAKIIEIPALLSQKSQTTRTLVKRRKNFAKGEGGCHHFMIFFSLTKFRFLFKGWLPLLSSIAKLFIFRVFSSSHFYFIRYFNTGAVFNTGLPPPHNSIYPHAVWRLMMMMMVMIRLKVNGISIKISNNHIFNSKRG